MEFKIGKRYRWSPYRSGKKKWKNGILKEIFDIDGVMHGKFVTRDNEEWSMPLHNSRIEEYKREE